MRGHEHDRHRQAEDQRRHQDRLVVRRGQHVLGSLDRLEDAWRCRGARTAAHNRTSGDARATQSTRAASRGWRRRPGRAPAPSRRRGRRSRTDHEPHRPVAGQAFEHELGGERDEHDRQRQVGGGEHGQGRDACRRRSPVWRVSSQAASPAPATTVSPSSSSRRPPVPRRERSASSTVAISRTADDDVGESRAARSRCPRRRGQLGDVDAARGRSAARSPRARRRAVGERCVRTAIDAAATMPTPGVRPGRHD